MAKTDPVHWWALTYGDQEGQKGAGVLLYLAVLREVGHGKKDQVKSVAMLQ